MEPDRAHARRRARARSRRVAGTVLVVASLALGSGCAYVAPPPASGSGSAPGPISEDSEFATAQHTLAALSGAVRRRDAGAAARLGTTSEVPARIVANARLLGIRDLRLRYVDAASTPAAASYGHSAWVGDVEVSYRLAADLGPTSFQTAVVFEPGSGGTARIAATGGYGMRGALWLQGQVQVRRARGLLLIAAAGQDVDRYLRLTRRAVAQVDDVVRRHHRPLVFEVPPSQRRLEQDLGADSGTYRLVAGVTGSVDGRSGSLAPLHSFFNARTMASQDEREAQVVVTHEAELQATRAPVTGMPYWLEEGFADYVALDHAGIPLRLAARHIVAQTRREGAPSHLPTQADFDPTDTDLSRLDAVYESAWLACRYVATTFGESKLVDLYEAIDEGAGFGATLGRVLGLSQDQLVRQWQAYLGRLSRAH